MKYELTDIEIEILKKLYSHKYCKLKGFDYKIDNPIISLEGVVASEQEIGYYLECLHKNNYIYMGKYSVERKDGANYRGCNICKVWWDSIVILQKGASYINEINDKGKHDKQSEITTMVYSSRKSKYVDAIKVISDYDSYLEISIETDNKIIDSILIDRDKLQLIQEYTWAINKDNMIITKRHYSNKNKRNISINQLIFKEELDYIYKLTSEKHIPYFKNGNILDKRRNNIAFMTRSNHYAINNLDRITGIYLSSNSNENRISYEVRINKNKERIYLLKTEDYREAFYGAFLLRLLFWGKEYTKPFMDRLYIDESTLNSLSGALKKYESDGTDTEIVKILISFNLKMDFVEKVLNTINRRIHLLV